MRKLLLLLAVTFCWSCTDESGDVGFIDGGGVGVGGSTARFAINGEFLYIVSNTDLKVINISSVADPQYQSSTPIGSGIETIFGFKGNLFIGGQSGMKIYTVDALGRPTYRSEFVHRTACDPVIANDQYAYVTTRSGEGCNNTLFEANRLVTLDVSNLDNPFDVDQQQMINPRGLAFFKGDLFVAEGASGLKQFSLEDPAHPVLIHFHTEIAANDMIALENTMIITRDDGIYQFGCVDEDLELFSPIQ